MGETATMIAKVTAELLPGGYLASLRCRHAELLLNCARIGFNP